MPEKRCPKCGSEEMYLNCSGYYHEFGWQCENCGYFEGDCEACGGCGDED